MPYITCFQAKAYSKQGSDASHVSSLRRSKLFLLAICTMAYLLAGAVALLTLEIVSGHIIFRLAIADLAATLVIWVIGTTLKNTSLYDPFWSVAPPLLIIGYAFFGGGVIGVPRGQSSLC